MKLATLRRTAGWVKRLAMRLLRPPGPPGPVLSPPDDLVKAAWAVLAALHADSNDAVARRDYAAVRRRLCLVLLNSDYQTLRILAGDDVFRLFIAPLHKNIDLLAEEGPFVRALPHQLRRSFGAGDEHTRRLLAAMLYYQPYELESRHCWHAIDHIDMALFPSLFSYLLNMTPYYSAVGEADAHLRFAERVLAALAERTADPAPGRRDMILDCFARHYNGDKRLISRSSMKGFFALERGFQQMMLDRGTNAGGLVPLQRFGGGGAKRRVGLLRLAFTLEFDYLMRPLSLLPPDRYELHVFAAGEDGLPAAAARYPNLQAHALAPGDVTASVNVIRRSGVDILINGSPLGGDFHGLCSAVMLTRAAPVQVMYCSDIMTSGIPAADFFLVGDVYLRDGLAEEFTEELVTCPGIGYYFPRTPPSPVDRDAVRAELGLSGGETLYTSSAHLFKITPELLGAWVRLLAADPAARLALMPVSADYMRPFIRGLRRIVADACREAGVARERLLLLDVRGRDAVARVLAAADVYLDSFPYSGPSSAVEALLAGTPVVTLPGATFRGTFVAGMLKTLSLESCVAASETEYVTLARRLATDGGLRREVRRRIRERLPAARFFNAELVARDLDAALSRLAPRAGRAPLAA